MVTKQLTLVISAKTETEIDIMERVLMLTLNNSSMRLQSNLVESNNNSNFNWDAETVVSEKEEDFSSYYEIADQLYSALIADNKRFSDWEYQFISTNYGVAEQKGRYTPKQKHWLYKLKEKYLG